MVIKGAAGPQEEQGFNEKELEDIMNEIENLESEFDDETEGKSAAVQPAPEIEEREEEPVAAKKTTPVRPQIVEEVQKQVKEVPCGMPAQMEFFVKGDMQMNLKFYLGETWVQFTVSPSDGLVFEMPGGMRFSVPVPCVVQQKSKKAS